MILQKFILWGMFLLVGSMTVHAQTGPNLALNKPVIASSTIAGNPALSLTDGNTTSWTGTNNTMSSPNAEFLQIDLGSDQLIEHIRIFSRDLQHNRGRRFMIITWPSDLGIAAGLGTAPNAYLTGATVSSYNRLSYTDASQTGLSLGNLVLGGALPRAAGVNLGPDYTARMFNVGIHKARYIRIQTLQDDFLDLAEVEVYGSSLPARRTLVNGGFESGSTVNTVQQTHEADVPGWSATEAVSMIGTTSPRNNPDNGSFIEMWGNATGVATPNQGNFFVELNAYTNGELSQTLCVLPGESFRWSLAHRGREGEDVMRLRINDIDVAEFRDHNTAAGTHAGSVLTPATTHLPPVPMKETAGISIQEHGQIPQEPAVS